MILYSWLVFGVVGGSFFSESEQSVNTCNYDSFKDGSIQFIKDYSIIQSLNHMEEGILDCNSDKDVIVKKLFNNFADQVKSLLKLLRNTSLRFRAGILRLKILKAKDFMNTFNSETGISMTVNIEDLIEIHRKLILDVLNFKTCVLKEISKVTNLIMKYKSYCELFIKFEKDVSNQIDQGFTISLEGKLDIPESGDKYVELLNKYNQLCNIKADINIRESY